MATRFATCAAALALAAAQQPEQVHIAVTGKAGEISLDFMVRGGVARAGQRVASRRCAEVSEVPCTLRSPRRRHPQAHKNCSLGYGAQIATTPEFSGASFVPAYACDDFTAQESIPTFAVRVLFQVRGKGARAGPSGARGARAHAASPPRRYLRAACLG